MRAQRLSGTILGATPPREETPGNRQQLAGGEPSSSQAHPSSQFDAVLDPMQDRWANAAGSYEFRFFSPEQADQILREGSKQGRTGSHAAIERILKHEPSLERPALWRRIRRLKSRPRPAPYLRSVWSPEDDQVLRSGYAAGWQGKQHAVRELLKRHPDWRAHVIWRRAAKFSLSGRKSKKGRERNRQPWSESDDRILLNLAGYKFARAIARRLHRTESAVRYRLAMLGKSSRVHKDGYARRALAEELHLGSKTVQRLIVEGVLEVRDPRITCRSLDDLRKSLPGPSTPTCGTNGAEEPASGQQAAPAGSDGFRDSEPGSNHPTTVPTRSSRAKRFWADAARTLGVSAERVERYIAKGVLKLQDPRVTEKSLRSLCRRYGSLINYDFLNPETRTWLRDSLDLFPTAGEAEAKRMAASRRHAQTIRKCETCGRAIRGNVYFRHIKGCGRMSLKG